MIKGKSGPWWGAGSRCSNTLMRTFFKDLRYAGRTLWKAPAFTAVAVLTLALGVGANTAMFSVVDAVMLRPLPYSNPERLVAVWLTRLDRDMRRASLSVPQFDLLREAGGSFDAMAVSRGEVVVATGGSEAEQIRGRLVTGEFFPLLGTEAVAGRTLDSSDAKADSPPAVNISYRLWQRRFGGQGSAVGDSITLNGESFVVAGVLPATFRDPRDFGASEWTDVWKPVTPQTDRIMGASVYQMLARLRPGVELDRAQTEMTALAGRLVAADPQRNAGLGVRVVPLRDSITEDVRLRLLLLLGAVGFVLLIACANVANLLLARATNRRAEMALRATLGAGRGRLVRLALTESLLLAAIGSALGVLFGGWALRLVTPLIPAEVPRTAQIALDGHLLLFSAALAIASGVLFGLVPALRVSRVSPGNELREGTRGVSAGPNRQRLAQALAVAEIAVALVLLAGGGLMLKSFWRLSHVDPGFRAEHALTFQLRLPTGIRSEHAQRVAFYQQLLAEVEKLPGVQHAGITAVLPLSGSTLASSFAVEGQPLPASADEAPQAETNLVSAGYFQALGLRLLRGRELTEQDVLEQRDVALVSEAMARRYWPGGEAVGKRIRFAPFDQDAPWQQIVGVVADVKHQGLEQTSPEQVYQPYSSLPPPMATLVVRHSGEDGPLAAAVKQRAHAINNDLPIHAIRPMDEIVQSSIAQPRFYTTLLGVFAGLGLLLAVLGVYGVLHYAVSRRTHEFGVRMALGASAGDVLRLVLGQALRLVVPGIALGLAASFALTRFLASELFEVSPTDPLVLAGLSLVLAVAAVAASWWPARRATRVQPVTALRYE